MAPFLEHFSITIEKDFVPTCGVDIQDGLVIGDEGGFVIHLNEDSVSKVLYTHSMAITDIILVKNRTVIITSGEDQLIKIYSLEEQNMIGEIDSETEFINKMAFHQDLNKFYSIGKSGKVTQWDFEKKS